MRSEDEIFQDLLTLCGSRGYAHALAMFSLRDNFITFRREMKPEDKIAERFLNHRDQKFHHCPASSVNY